MPKGKWRARSEAWVKVHDLIDRNPTVRTPFTAVSTYLISMGLEPGEVTDAAVEAFRLDRMKTHPTATSWTARFVRAWNVAAQRAPELVLPALTGVPTREVQREAELAELSVDFIREMGAFIAVYEPGHAPGTVAGMRRDLLGAARFLRDKGIEPNRLADLVTPEALAIYVKGAAVAHGVRTAKNGVPKPSHKFQSILHNLRQMASRHLSDADAERVAEKQTHISRSNGALPIRRQRLLDDVCSEEKHAALLENLAEIAVAADEGNARKRRVDEAAAVTALIGLSVLLDRSELLTLAFDGEERVFDHGTRPRLCVTRKGVRHDVEQHISKSVVSLLDHHFLVRSSMGAEPKHLNEDGGSPIKGSGLDRRIAKVTAMAGRRVSSNSIRDIAIMGLIRRNELSDEEISRAAGYESTQSFLARWKVVIDHYRQTALADHALSEAVDGAAC